MSDRAEHGKRGLYLVLGGARSGKSRFAVELAGDAPRVLFVATAEPGDEEMAARIRRHRVDRPEGWETVEEPIDLAGAIEGAAIGDRESGATDPAAGTGSDAAGDAGPLAIVIDCLTLWVSNVLLRHDSLEDAERELGERLDRVLTLRQQLEARWVVVSGEVGSGVVPATRLGRDFRDALGRVNQRLAAEADEVYLLTAGLALGLKSLGARPAGG